MPNGRAFIKMHGLGNDFVIVDAREQAFVLNPESARAITDRREGVGCDQLIVMEPPESPGADVFMRIRNADGGEVEACGNAARCVAALVMAEKEGGPVVIETLAGLLPSQAAAGEGLVTVDMGPVAEGWEAIPLAEPQDTLHLTLSLDGLSDPVAVNVGNPHAVFFVEDCEAVALAELGPRLEHDPLFPDRANISAATLTGPDQLRLRVWERGVGITRACGTGACAAAVAAARRGMTGRRIQVTLDGGPLTIEWRDDNHVVMTGPVATRFYRRAGVMTGGPLSEAKVLTFGCRLNAYESEVMLQNARDTGLGAAVIVNTCAVTSEAERQARQAIRRARRDHPEARIVVTGCAAQIDPEGYGAMAEVDQVLGNEEKLRPDAFRTDAGPRIQVNDIMSVKETAGHLLQGFAERSRAFVQVQQGCDHRCTFCIIPYGRGNSRSVPLGALVRQVRHLVERGMKEVVLTGVDITSYGADLPGSPALGQLVPAPASPGTRAEAPAPVVPRCRGTGRGPVPAAGGGAAPDAAPAPFAAVRRRHDLKAHEAAPSAGRCRRPNGSHSPAASGHCLRRRPDRRLSDRERGDVRKQPGPDRRLRPGLSSRLSLLAKAGHPGRAHAAGTGGAAQGTGRAPAHRRGSGLVRLSRQPARDFGPGAGRKARIRP